jgi:inner membrane protein
MDVKIKGSEQLHFQPYAGNSRFTLKSDWKNPSFDGSDLPSQRAINDSGFVATWNFNKANLSFGTVLKDFKLDPGSLSFGVTLVQPADGYAKTDRSIKYAILFIGLTFSLFFIIELLQKKPIHPVQYVLIGLALIIFYTLLLSMSEFIAFDLAYFIAALATILLISFYAYGHFKSFKTASVFGGVLVLLYGFTFVLIRLEDTALLLGSVGLFIILAIAMYASRKVNWYGQRNGILDDAGISRLTS